MDNYLTIGRDLFFGIKSLPVPTDYTPYHKILKEF